jgi:hypothetical protein
MPVASNTLDLQARSNAGRARKRKPLTAREKAAKADRIAAYEARNAALKAGTFKGVVEQAAEAKARSEAERMAETAKARTAVVAAMSHAVYGERLTRFIGNRPAADPCTLLVLISNWKRTQGIVEHTLPVT